MSKFDGGKIFTVLPRIIQDIDSIQKKVNPNSQFKYAYRGIDAFMNHLNPLLAKHNVTIMPEVLDVTRESWLNANGTKMTSVVMKIKYSFYAEDGSSTSCIMIGESFDSGDKASNKAQSIALKYAIMQVFMVPTEDIDDPDDFDTSTQPKQDPQKKQLVNHAPQSKSDVDKGADYVKSGKSVSEAQLKRLYAIVKNSFYSEDEVKNLIKEKFNKNSSKELNMVEYDELCKIIEGNK